MESLALSCPGAAIASAISKMPTYRSDMEGLIFGVAKAHLSMEMSDSTEHKAERTDLSLGIQNFVTTGSPFSFYDAAGNIDKGKLDKLVAMRPNQALLGWFKMRGSSPLRPSLRETIVFRGFQEYQETRLQIGEGSAPQPSFFGLFASESNHHSRIHTYDHKFFHHSPGSNRLTAIRMNITNLSSGTADEYKTFDASSALFLGSNLSTDPLQDIINGPDLAPWRQMIQETPPSFIRYSEAFLQATILKLEELAKQASDSTADVLAQQRIVDELSARLEKQHKENRLVDEDDDLDDEKSDANKKVDSKNSKKTAKLKQKRKNAKKVNDDGSTKEEKNGAQNKIKSILKIGKKQKAGAK